MSKFKVGDKIIGNSKASKYNYSNEGWQSVVSVVYSNNTFSTPEWSNLDDDCFDLVNPPMDDILRECAKRYPIGIKYIPLYSVGGAHSDPTTSLYEPRLHSGDLIDVGIGYVYVNGVLCPNIRRNDIT